MTRILVSYWLTHLILVFDQVVDNVIELTSMLSISRPSAHYRAHADFMGIGVTADADIDIHDVQIYMDATATLTAEGIPEGGLQLKNFYVSDRKKKELLALSI